MKSFKITLLLCSLFVPSLAFSGDIIHDSEFQLLQKPYGEKWAAEDNEIGKKLEKSFRCALVGGPLRLQHELVYTKALCTSG